MPPPVFSSPFPKFKLSIDEKEEIVHTSDNLVNEVQQQFEKFLWKDQGQLNSRKWETLREKDGVCVYRDREPGAEAGNKRMHSLFTVGSVVGNLNDAMYGVLNHTTEDMRIKTAYVDDAQIDSIVLETIQEPRPDKPFQSMSLRWFVKSVPMRARIVSQHLDSVYFESVGTKQLSNGETIGYHVMHSLVLDKAPPIPVYNFSACFLWRQMSSQRVQLYMTMYVELNESFVTPLLIKSMADALVGVCHYTECAQLKKLAWLVQTKRMMSEADADDRSTNRDDGCSVCGSRPRLARKGTKAACAACAKYTCKRCTTKQELSMFAPDGQLLKQVTRFCLPCMTVAKQLDAEIVAQDEAAKGALLKKRGKYGSSHALSSSRSYASSESSQISDSSRYGHSAWSSVSTAKPSQGAAAVRKYDGIIV
jgi:hypothetical protein